MTAIEAHLYPESIHFIVQIEHGFNPGHVDVVHGSHFFDSPDGIDRLFREFHYPVRRLNNGAQ